ncbi:MAG: PKD domain-containing protein, partial [bacterium]|nr:PKD domain-containing protein [bacterium]
SDGNRSPIVNAVADPVAGLAPLSVTFSSAGSYDPDNEELSYNWNFADGTTSQEANPTHIFTDNGSYDVTLTASDSGKSAQTSVTVTVGNQLPVAAITSPITDSKYNAGDTISFSGTGSDPEDGELPESAFEWSFRFHHGTHTHPFYQTVTGSKSGSFVIPRDADNLSNTWYAITLTVTDAGGLKNTTTKYIYPNLVTLTFTTNFPGTNYTIDGIPYTNTHTEQAVVGVERVIAMPKVQFVNGVQYRFGSWSDGGTQSHTITTPATSTAYQSNYMITEAPAAPWQLTAIGPQTVGEAFFSDDELTISSASEDIWDTFDGLMYVHQPLNGDGQITARVTSQTDTNEWAKAGVIIKDSTTYRSPYAMMAVTPGNGYTFQHSYNAGTDPGPYTFPNAWVRLKREGNTITGFTSPDGQNWTQVSQATLNLNDDITMGLFATSHHGLLTSTAIFDNITVETGKVAAPWVSEDIGAPRNAGSSSYANGVYTLNGAGDDIWDTTDQFHFVHQSLPANGEIIARVTSLSNTNDWAKAGVMMKESATALSPYA